jgi:hypothetical protein
LAFGLVRPELMLARTEEEILEAKADAMGRIGERLPKPLPE